MKEQVCDCNHWGTEERSQEDTAKEVSQLSNKASFLIKGMDCGTCAVKLEKGLGKTAGVYESIVNFNTGKLTIEASLAKEEIIALVETFGYQASPWIPGKKLETINLAKWYQQPKTAATLISALFWILGMSLSFAGKEAAANLSFAATMVSGGFYIAKSGMYALKRFSLDTNFLMTVAAIGAVIIDQWSEGATVVFLFAVGNALQAYTLDKTRQSIKSLMELAPSQALVKRDGKEITLPVEEIVVGDMMIVKPGMRIAMDGTIIDGLSAVDQASITGESVPVEKEAGDGVYAGTMNGTGALTVTVTKLAADSTLSKIMTLVEDAQSEKAPLEQQVDQFAKYYTPVVLIGAAIVAAVPPMLFGGVWSEWIYRALVLLVISCPCALVISTPVSIVSAIGRASRMGVLIKGGVYLEQLGMVNAVAFDKTGTLTYGKPVVTKVIAIGEKTEKEVMQLAASVEKWSEHPLAQAILNAVDQSAVKESSAFKAFVGSGAVAKVSGEEIYVGNRRLFNEIGQNVESYEAQITALEEMGKTVILVGTKTQILGIIGMNDTIRSNAESALKALKDAGVAKLVMLTGDNEKVASLVAQELAVDEYYSGLLPENKVEMVKKLNDKHGKVAMIGDGVNDAPALATANIGVAMGSMGSDAALETADIALMSDDLSKLAKTIALSRKTVAIIRQNITFSIVIKLVFIVGTFVGFTNLWLAVLADSGAAVLVTLNGMRLAKE